MSIITCKYFWHNNSTKIIFNNGVLKISNALYKILKFFFNLHIYPTSKFSREKNKGLLLQ